MKMMDIIAVGVCAAACGGLFWLAGYADRVKSTKWKIFWLIVPLLAIGVSKHGLTVSLLPLYLGAVIAALGFFTELSGIRRRLAAAGAACMLLSFPVCLLNPRYRAKDYLGDFEKLSACMREHYVLTDHKGIDWDALYAKYQPKFAEIDRTQDAGANLLTWGAFCGEFHDGHVGYTYSIKEDMAPANQAIREALGHDYGLSLMRCTDGSFAAVHTDESLAEYGIRNGTVITAWDGRSPDEVSRTAPLYDVNFFVYDEEKEEPTLIMGSYPDIDNEIFWSGVLCAGVGGDSVTVTYLDENGAEQTAVLPQCGDYLDRLTGTVKTVGQSMETGNLMWKRISRTTACLRIKGMSFDMKSYNSADDDAYDEMKNEIRQQILEYQQDGVKDVIIDLRGNEGGSPHMVNGVTAMFAPKGVHYCLTNCVWDEQNHCWAKDASGRYVKGNDIVYQGEQLLGDGRIIVLVDSATVSAGDIMTKEMEGLENVTVIGFTEPNGSSQAVGMKAGKCGTLSFSNCVVLDENGEIAIDSGIDRQSGDGDGVKIIPFDGEAIRALFDEGRDYLMDKALEMLEQ